jgi:hypothetical protein
MGFARTISLSLSRFQNDIRAAAQRRPATKNGVGPNCCSTHLCNRVYGLSKTGNAGSLRHPIHFNFESQVIPFQTRKQKNGGAQPNAAIGSCNVVFAKTQGDDIEINRLLSS